MADEHDESRPAGFEVTRFVPVPTSVSAEAQAFLGLDASEPSIRRRHLDNAVHQPRPLVRGRRRSATQAGAYRRSLSN